jgi:hypothetical protein
MLKYLSGIWCTCYVIFIRGGFTEARSFVTCHTANAAVFPVVVVLLVLMLLMLIILIFFSYWMSFFEYSQV